MEAALTLGPMLRHTDGDSAAVWVETSRAGEVTVRLPGRDGQQVWRAPTFGVHGHHYALVEVTGLQPGERAAYQVLLDDQVVWPEPGDPLPAPHLSTSPPEGPLRLAFGSCRTSVPHDVGHEARHGVDALRTYAVSLSTGEPGPLGVEPDLLLLLGDQVYADSTSAAMREFIATRRSLTEGPGAELADYQEYAHLYRLAWTEPPLRWLFSWLPSLMIFDDHDIRDDWNTSLAWRQEMEQTSWWHGRVVAGLGSYWVYQHLGNLSVAARAEDPLWRELQRRQDGHLGEVDLTDAVDAHAERADRDPLSYRWSYTHPLGDSHLVVVDSRAARNLDPQDRAMLDEAEMAWLDEQLTGDVRHLLIGTSLPYLLPPGIHHLEAWNEALVAGVWGSRWRRPGEWLRQELDLEHWAAFHESFERVAGMVTEVAQGRRGTAPASVIFLSGDVHHSYITEVVSAGGSRILQFVCSPIRNPMPVVLRAAFAVVAHGIARPLGLAVARAAGVPDPSLRWRGVAGPWFDNNLAVLDIEGTDLRTVWLGGRRVPGVDEEPQLTLVAEVELDVPEVGAPTRAALARVHPRDRSWRRPPVRSALGGAAVAVAAVCWWRRRR